MAHVECEPLTRLHRALWWLAQCDHRWARHRVKENRCGEEGPLRAVAVSTGMEYMQVGRTVVSLVSTNPVVLTCEASFRLRPVFWTLTHSHTRDTSSICSFELACEDAGDSR